MGPSGYVTDLSLLENRFLRGALGLRLVAGAVVLGMEGSVAAGENAVQRDPLEACVTGGCAIPRQRIRLWSAAARLGFTF